MGTSFLPEELEREKKIRDAIKAREAWDDAHSFKIASFWFTGEVEEEKREKRYEFGLTEEDDNTSQYQSRITYQMTTQYASKGKYKVDSSEEEF